MSSINTTPVTEQIFSILYERIRSGVYSPGEQLPSEYDIATDLRVSRASVRTALARLEASGQITRRHGEGTFVNKRLPSQNVAISIVWEFSKLIKENGHVPRIEAVSTETRLILEDEREKLDLTDPQEKVLDIIRVFYADEEPVIYTKNIIPYKLLNTDPANIDATKQISQVLRDYCDMEIGYIDSYVSADTGNEMVNAKLNLRDCNCLLRLEEVFFSTPEEIPVLLSDSYLNTMKIRLHRVRPRGSID
jgi:GntR family transcriptional regulator